MPEHIPEQFFSNLQHTSYELLNGESASVAIIICRNQKSQIILDELISTLTLHDCMMTSKEIFAVNSAQQFPLVAQALSETMLFDAIIAVDIRPIHSSNQAIQAAELASVNQALHECELESGIVLTKGLMLLSENEFESEAYLKNTAKKFAEITLESMNMVALIREIGLMNAQEQEDFELE